MKRITFFKSLLLAAGLMVGANVWAETVNPSATKVTPGVSESTGKTATSWTVCQIQAVGENGFKGNGPAVIANFDLSTFLSGKILVSATLNFSMTAGAYNSSINIFEIGTDWDASTAVWNDISSKRISTVTSAEQWTTKNATTNHSFDIKQLVEDDADKVVGFLIAVNTTREQTLSNLTMEVVAADASSVTTYSVVKYDINGNVLSSQSAISGIVGNTITVSDADKATFYSGDTNSKYVFDASDTRNVTSMELTSTEETNVLKLYFDTYSKYTASVQPVCGENAVAAISGSWYADETPVTLYWPKVINCSDGYYVVDADASEPRYGHTFSTTDLSMNVTYTLDESIVYYTEYEDRCGKVFSGLYFSSNSSKGSSRALTGSNTMTTNMNRPNAGIYNITVSGGNRDTGHTTTLEMKLRASDNTISADNVLTQYFKGGQWIGEMTANNVFIPAGSELYVANDNGDGNAKFAGDYIIVKKSKVSVIVANEYATYANHDFALDFTDVEGLTAYTATVKDANTVTFTPATKVPAGTGLLLKGATADVPVIASAEEITGNVLYAPTEEVTGLTYDDGTYYNYILTSKNGKVGFYKANNSSVAVGKAYIRVAKSVSGSRDLTFIGFDDDNTTTGIDNVITNLNDNNVFDLQGRRVNQPVKGLYIMNGKKVIFK